MSISKIGTLNVLVEALNFASGTHQNNLEQLLQNAEEALVEPSEGDEPDVDMGDGEEEEDSTES
jgi:hypothetical protein